MKKIIFILSLITVANVAFAGDEISVEKGRELFTNISLGSNGKSCSLCHANGKGMEKAAGYDEGELSSIINMCITNPLKGTALSPSSSKMKSLVMYIKSFAKSGRN